MVTFELESKSDEKVVYKYYPENRFDSACGLISIWLDNKDVTIDVAAEEDFVCRALAKEMNAMRDDINAMRLENGEPPLTEEDLPIVTEDEEWYYYADHVIRRILDDMENGNIPDKGTVAWY